MARSVLLAGLGLVAGYALPSGVGYSRASRLVGVHRRVRAADRVCLTFDDGPQPGATEHFLRLLDDLSVPATFFLVGEQVSRCAALVREIHAAGHQIGNHGFWHRNHFVRWPLDVIEDCRRGAEAIADVTGEPPDLYRPPQGVVTAATRYAAFRVDSAVVLWSSWGRDWRPAATTDSIAHDVLRSAGGGSIILLHDGDRYSGRTWHATRAAVPRIVETLRGKGLSFTSIESRAALG